MQNHWRSLLFVPADNPSRQQKAATVGADAVILDLEDGVAADAKASAREGIAAAATQLHDAGVTVTVRINTGWQAVMADLNAAVCPAVSAIMLPKVESAAHAEVIGEMLGEFEVERGLPLGSIGLIALIESPAGLTALDDIAKVERVIGLALGPEDFSLELGVCPTPNLLDYPARQIALAASSRHLMALGVPISIAEFRDMDAYTAAAVHGAEIGINGALCIHPNQVTAANQCFKPSDEAIEQAKAILDAWEQAKQQGQAVTALNGQMIDLPVAERAERLLAAVS